MEILHTPGAPEQFIAVTNVELSALYTAAMIIANPPQSSSTLVAAHQERTHTPLLVTLHEFLAECQAHANRCTSGGVGTIEQWVSGLDADGVPIDDVITSEKDCE